MLAERSDEITEAAFAVDGQELKYNVHAMTSALGELANNPPICSA